MSQGWLERLVSCGFERSGSWILDDAHRARFHAEIEIPKQPGVYAYAVDGEICYIGSAQRGLQETAPLRENQDPPYGISNSRLDRK
jgi:hypothetical protein